jgi:hypothetical protein
MGTGLLSPWSSCIVTDSTRNEFAPKLRLLTNVGPLRDRDLGHDGMHLRSDVGCCEDVDQMVSRRILYQRKLRARQP